MLCFRKSPVALKFMDKRAGGVSRISVENISSQSAEKIRRGTLLCCVSEKFWQQKGLWIRGRGEYKSSFENYLSDSAENFRRATL